MFIIKTICLHVFYITCRHIVKCIHILIVKGNFIKNIYCTRPN